MSSSHELFNADLLKRYAVDGPRYTSYPSAPIFAETFDAPAYRAGIARASTRFSDLSLYVHIPFCDTVCFYCGCNKVITRNRARADTYLRALRTELALQSELFSKARPVRQLHWGGGTPTFLSGDQLTELMGWIGEYFTLLGNDAGEYSIEIDPRAVDPDTIRLLRELGFNRLSLGVQDFDARVQQAVNRIQSREMTADAIDRARDAGFKSISVDLIYGLPHQSVFSFSRTLDMIIELAPDRLSVFGYSHLPQLFKMQRLIDADALPSAAQRLEILHRVIERLTAAGYVYIGMDHFARPDDELAIAQRRGTLHRNFQGYSTQADCDLIGVGVSSIGKIGDIYAQNEKTLARYESSLERRELPIARGLRLSHDDLLRRDVIGRLMCGFVLRYADIEVLYDIHFTSYFADELERLRDFERDGLLCVGDERIAVHMPGRLLIRNVCMVFDRYLRATRYQAQYSRTV
jgi:oxygen-independent coproporphyrinogen III oxidase